MAWPVLPSGDLCASVFEKNGSKNASIENLVFIYFAVSIWNAMQVLIVCYRFIRENPHFQRIDRSCSS